jgi:tuberous sclerosis 2
MSPQQQDAEISTRSRPRANTTTFTFPSWRRGRNEVPPPPPPAAPTPAPPLSIEALIRALNPPAVPSLTHARSLAGLLTTQTPLPRPVVLHPILANLCGKNSPPSLQMAGYDIVTAYWENEGASSLSTADRLSYFSLFLGASSAWSPEIWEARFKALRALSSSGTEVMGMESRLLDLLKFWIQGAFQGLLSYDLVDPAERSERERSIDALTASVTSVVENLEIVARIPEQELTGVLDFYADLVERALDLPSDFVTQVVLASNPFIDVPGSATSTPTRPSTHRRHPSSLSVTTVAPSIVSLPIKHPADIAVTVYINHLTCQLKTLAPSHLTLILPLLFRALAFYASPLPRLSIAPAVEDSSPLEKKLTDTITSLFGGPFATSCVIMLKDHLYPPIHSDGKLKSYAQASIGAHRTFRKVIRRRLYIRIARAYINRESSVNYTPSGAPGHMDLERDLMERAWPKDDVQGWDADRLSGTLSKSVGAWVNFLPTDGDDLNIARQKIMEEAAGTLKDVFQELDMRDDNTVLDDEAASVVGETLSQLASYVRSVKCVLFTTDRGRRLLTTFFSKKPGWHSVHYSTLSAYKCANTFLAHIDFSPCSRSLDILESSTFHNAALRSRSSSRCRHRQASHCHVRTA